MQTGISDQTFNLDIERCVRVRAPSVVQMGERQRWRAGLVCKISVLRLSGFESHLSHKYGPVD